MTSNTGGILAMVAACVIWGLSPIYYKPLSDVPTAEVLAHRTLWSLIAFSGLLALQGRLSALRAALATPRAIAITLVAAAMISTNWFLFILSVQVGRVTEAALGYYIFPLVAVVLGVVTFGERLTRLQWLAVALALGAVVFKTWAEGVPPWIGIVLAVTFSIYGVVKKRLAAGPVATVTAEVTLLAPLAVGYLAWTHGVFGGAGQGVFGLDPFITGLLAFSGLVTALPLILFSRAAQRVSLATVGLVQYLNPTLQFLCAVLLFGEAFTRADAVVFGLIWAALALYSAAGFSASRAARRSAMTSAAEPPV
jgi:chloramphenicol-sensitive protein RarD